MAHKNNALSTDICVVGGGPAGSTIAYRLAALGFDVCVVNSGQAHRFHTVASLPQSILPLLESFAARDVIENAGFLRQTRSIIWWSESAPVIRDDSASKGLIVERERFDRLLLEHAKSAGVRVFQPAMAEKPVRVEGGGWAIKFTHDGALKEIDARILVDASGGQNLLPGKRLRGSPPLIALYAYWEGKNVSETTGCVEAGLEEWLWYTPLDDTGAIAVIFIDPKRLSKSKEEDILSLYHSLLGQFQLFPGDRLRIGAGGVTACDASSRFSADPVGFDFIRVGDAYLSLDPLSSQGIQSAIASSLQAAIVVNTLLRSTENSESAVQFYRDRQQEKIQQYTAKTAGFYAERASVSKNRFWTDRGAPEHDARPPEFEQRPFLDHYRIKLSDAAEIKSIPVIKGDLIVSTPALHHNLLDRPSAFLGGIEIVPLLLTIQSGQTIGTVIEDWSGHMPPQMSPQIMNWLWSRKIILPE